MAHRVCIVCGAQFTGTKYQTKCPTCAAASKAAAVVRDRTCRQCSAVFPGGPRAWYCLECRAERTKERDRKRKAAQPARKLGSTDTCEVCGAEYIVEGGKQRYCKASAPEAVKAKDRADAIAWNQANLDYEQRAEERRAAVPMRKCRVCGKDYRSKNASVTCNAECAAIYKQQTQQQWEAAHRAERNARARENYKKRRRSQNDET